MTLSRYEHAPKERNRTILKCLEEANGELTTREIARRCGYSRELTLSHLDQLHSVHKVFKREMHNGFRPFFVWSVARKAEAA